MAFCLVKGTISDPKFQTSLFSELPDFFFHIQRCKRDYLYAVDHFLQRLGAEKPQGGLQPPLVRRGLRCVHGTDLSHYKSRAEQLSWLLGKKQGNHYLNMMPYSLVQAQGKVGEWRTVQYLVEGVKVIFSPGCQLPLRQE